jgi:hypothetical protein
LELIDVYTGVQEESLATDPVLGDKRKLGVGAPS